MIVVNVFLLKFSASLVAASQSGLAESCFKNQKYFTKVSGQGKCETVIEKFHSFSHSIIIVQAAVLS